jgi:hypothetical protein
MKKEFQIPTPCEQKWDNMQNASGGKFCDLCTKKVFDLTDKTDTEIHSLLKENKSICGKIQSTRLYSTPEHPQIHYNFSQFPFRKIAGGVFLAAMLTSNLNAQKPRDTTEVKDIQGMVQYVVRDPDYEPDKDWKFYRPETNTVSIEYSGSKKTLQQAERINILTVAKRYSASYSVSVPEYDLGFKNIMVFETQSNEPQMPQPDRFYLFSDKKNREDETILYANLDKAKKIEFKPKKNTTLCFLDGAEISFEDYEKNKNNSSITSYYLSEIYAEELLGKEYHLEDGIIVSYSR